jgi:hypothetical protein
MGDQSVVSREDNSTDGGPVLQEIETLTLAVVTAAVYRKAQCEMAPQTVVGT